MPVALGRSDPWWRTAVVYCLDVATFMDGDGDGVGDFEGLANRLGYLRDLGVNCLWLMPFYPSPHRDGGYDVADYYGVDPRLGTLGDVTEFIRIARDQGIRVIIDLVINHTSDRHPWFLSAKRSRSSPYRDYYVWRDEPPRKEQPLVFPGEETSQWELEPKSGQYYLHSFYRHQPDLNLENPAVRREMGRVLAFWLSLGISGFRVDAVPFLIQGAGVADAGDPHGFLEDMKTFIMRRAGDAVLLGETGLPQREQLAYFGGDDGGQLDMQFDFEIMDAAFLAFARHDPAPVVRALRSRPAIAEQSAWVNVLRNHDELNLGMISAEEREEVFEAFAPDERQRVYGRGIIRRLAPMLGGEPRRLRLAYSLLFSLPGVPMLFYGEEIGMGEDARVFDRSSVRTPMQWTAGRSGGFSTAPPSRLRPAMPDGAYAPQHVNADDQMHDPDALQPYVRALITAYRASPEIGWGELEIVEHDTPEVLVHALEGEATGWRFVAVHNFSEAPASVRFKLRGEPEGTRLEDLLEPRPPVEDVSRLQTVALEGYGSRWYRVLRPGDTRLS